MGLAKAASDRYPSMRDLGEALARWLLDRGVTEDSVGTSLRRAWASEVSSVVSVKDLVEPGELVPAVGALERASTQALRASSAPQAPISVRIRPSPADAHGPVMVALEEALKPTSLRHSVPDLEALAELHRGGDPEESAAPRHPMARARDPGRDRDRGLRQRVLDLGRYGRDYAIATADSLYDTVHARASAQL